MLQRNAIAAWYERTLIQMKNSLFESKRASHVVKKSYLFVNIVTMARILESGITLVHP